MNTYALLSDGKLFRVRGLINSKGNLEWYDKDGTEGVSHSFLRGQRQFSTWRERKKAFPGIPDAK
jgi:hypothetical protein